LEEELEKEVVVVEEEEGVVEEVEEVCHFFLNPYSFHHFNSIYFEKKRKRRLKNK